VRGGAERVLVELDDLQGVAYANDWSADGQHILFDTRGAAADTWRLQLTDDARPTPVSNAPEFHELRQRLSPDARWIAYESDEAGQADVFIRPFAGSGRAERISVAGGGWPQWRRDGRELYYLAPDGQIMVTQIEPGAILKASVPHPLFTVNAVQTQKYAVTADGQRFLMVTDVNDDPLGVTVVVNWPATVVK
jgi:Tol biopolymer transport system component